MPSSFPKQISVQIVRVEECTPPHQIFVMFLGGRESLTGSIPQENLVVVF